MLRVGFLHIYRRKALKGGAGIGTVFLEFYPRCIRAFDLGS